MSYYLEIARHLGCRADSLRTELDTTPEDERQADLAWSRLDLGRHERVICLNTGGAFGPAKCWPVEHFAAPRGGSLARRGRVSWSSAGPANAKPHGRS